MQADDPDSDFVGNLCETNPGCYDRDDARRIDMFNAAPTSAAVASHRSHDQDSRSSPSGTHRRSTNSPMAASRRAAPAASARAQPSTAPTTAASSASGKPDGANESNI